MSHSNVTSDRNVTADLTIRLCCDVYNIMVGWWRAVVVLTVAWHRLGRNL